ncbi:hypothetical protein [Novosphingobium sp. FSW06-99]|uniref:hypothetical protein n=1 Tax=Novosphingobium sp. FSW06-99 TaxID=1739113 RepID=UPI00076D55E2|nr:hypothetical protein [Novosphingobium sp. FSW06-99]KUR79846.1 hypothetical protein AQZ49_04585 [Novosphingobium sp. FSW06-99]
MAQAAGRLLLLNIGSPSRLLSTSLQGDDIQVLASGLGLVPDGIAIDAANRYIFWTSMGTSHEGEDFFANDGSVGRMDLDGSNPVTIVPVGQTFTPKQIQYVPSLRMLYWCDREGLRVMRARPDGSDLTVLVETGASDQDRQDRRRHCVGVAVDTAAGHLYWTQKGRPDGGEGRILRAPLDLPPGVLPGARQDIDVLFDALPEPIDLEWVGETGHLYWTDRGTPPEGNTLNRARIQPGIPPAREILFSGLHEGIGLAIDRRNRRAYVSDLGGYVHALDLDRPAEATVIFSGHGPLTGIAILAA